jgi:alpha-L-glutamate ligase-like protein
MNVMSVWKAWRARLRDMLVRRDALVGINRRNVSFVYANNPRSAYPEADDKLLCKELMAAHHVGLARTLVVCDGLYAIPQTLDVLRTLEHFVLKPANSSGGAGIIVVGERCGDGVWKKASGNGQVTIDELRYRLGEIVFGAFSGDLDDRAFVEERIFPHRVFQDFWSGGLCDVRVITLDALPFFAMVRVPTFESDGRANLHQGGIGLALDINTGMTTRAYYRGRSITHHPEGGALLIGVQLPDWQGILETARRAARSVRLGYLGVDVVVDEVRGPMVLEVNARPGLEIQNVHARGLAEALELVRAQQSAEQTTTTTAPTAAPMMEAV